MIAIKRKQLFIAMVFIYGFICIYYAVAIQTPQNTDIGYLKIKFIIITVAGLLIEILNQLTYWLKFRYTPYIKAIIFWLILSAGIFAYRYYCNDFSIALNVPFKKWVAIVIGSIWSTWYSMSTDIRFLYLTGKFVTKKHNP